MDITFKNVTYIYQEKTPFAHQALNDISLHIPAGKYVAIIGHTGSGKSTLIQHLNGLLTPTKGTVQIGNYTITADKKPEDLKQLRSQVGVVFQYPEHQLFEETIAKDIAFGDRKSTRLNSSHVAISYAVFCLKKKSTKISQSNAYMRLQGVSASSIAVVSEAAKAKPEEYSSGK